MVENAWEVASGSSAYKRVLDGFVDGHINPRLVGEDRI
jgi:hypothetical protein